MDNEEIRKELFEPALDAFQRIMIPYSIAFGSRLDCVNCLPATFLNYNPSFDQWYSALKKDTNGFSPDRNNKIKQCGNLLVSQPTGGFQLGNGMNKATMIQQYENAIRGDTPTLMVITEPFKESFLDGTGLHYRYLSNGAEVGILTNDAFEAQYTVTPEQPTGLPRVFLFTIESGTETIVVANYHGDSKGNIAEFKKFLEWASANNVNCAMGDSNITVGKTGKHVSELVTGTCSVYPIEKSRVVYDIILNNQIEKGKAPAEVDGMFIVGGEPNQLQTTVLKAFDTPYSPETPILADHGVVTMQVGSVLIKSASGARMDDPKIGIFSKPEWMNVNLDKFHTKYGVPYTREWCKIYNAFITAHPQYADRDNGNLKLLTVKVGGTKRRQRQRKTRKTRKTRQRTKKLS